MADLVQRGHRLHGAGPLLPDLPPAAVQPPRPGHQPHVRDLLRDTIPLLMVPDDLIEAIYGPAARPLSPGNDVAGPLQDMMRRPEVYWDAVFKVRAHLARHHSFQQRLQGTAGRPGELRHRRRRVVRVRGAAMKILFVMDRRVDRGSIQAVANYVCAGDELGHMFAVYGREDPAFPRVRFSTDASDFDHVMFIFESSRHWLSGLRVPQILSGVPRQRRAILDADGMYNQIISVDGYDRNYVYEHVRSGWLAHYNIVADRIMQPTLVPRDPGVIGLPFYGYDPASRISPDTSPPKRFDILCIGHNWWRLAPGQHCPVAGHRTDSLAHRRRRLRGLLVGRGAGGGRRTQPRSGFRHRPGLAPEAPDPGEACGVLHRGDPGDEHRPGEHHDPAPAVLSSQDLHLEIL